MLSYTDRFEFNTFYDKLKQFGRIFIVRLLYAYESKTDRSALCILFFSHTLRAYSIYSLYSKYLISSAYLFDIE